MGAAVVCFSGSPQRLLVEAPVLSHRNGATLSAPSQLPPTTLGPSIVSVMLTPHHRCRNLHFPFKLSPRWNSFYLMAQCAFACNKPNKKSYIHGMNTCLELRWAPQRDCRHCHSTAVLRRPTPARGWLLSGSTRGHYGNHYDLYYIFS